VFIKWKPTVINWLFAVVFLGSHWIGERPLVERMMSHAIKADRPVWMRLSWLWIGFFTGIGVLNLYVAYNYPEETWVNFKLFGMLGITLAFVVGQAFYLSRYVEDHETPEKES
jgi:intracellular septation protein